MNDRFKFRVWDKENNKMFTSLRHFNYSNVNGTIVCIESFCQYDGFYQKRIIKEFNDAILMQCTGLKDKNGKSIYEGDVVKPLSGFSVGYLGEIKFGQRENYQCFYVNWHTKRPILRGDLYFWLEDKEEGLEVIGNIYENPELLKECE